MPNKYWNRFNPSKKWSDIRFLSGRVLQSAELNEMQSIYNHKLKFLSDVFISDGSIISGCNIITPASYPNKVRILSGQVYVNGNIVAVDEQDVEGDFTGIGIENIWIDVQQEIVTELMDSSLYDPAIEEVNFGLEGAHRTILKAKFYNESTKPVTAIKFWRLVEGKVLFNPPPFGADKIVKVMENRTYEESGNYLVEGAKLVLNDIPDDPTKFMVILEPFQSYLFGKELDSVMSQVLAVDKPVTVYNTEDVIQVSQNIGSKHGGQNNVFALRKKFVKNVTTVVYPVKEIKSIYHPVSNGSEVIPVAGSVAKVNRVYKGGTEYVLGDDYLVNYPTNTIDWSPAGAEPPAGSSYNVEVIWYYTFTVESEGVYDPNKFIIEYPNADKKSYELCHLIIKDSRYTAEHETSILNIEYSAYMYRTDAVVLDREGHLQVLQGNLSQIYPAPKPRIDTQKMMLLYFLELMPGHLYSSLVYKVIDKRVFRITQQGLNIMRDQIEKLRENFMFTQLDQKALEIPVLGLLNGVYTDTFLNMDKADFTFEGSSVYSDAYDAGFDDNRLTLSPIQNQLRRTPIVNESQTTLQSGMLYYTLPYTEVIEISQLLGTTVVSVQPYALPLGGQMITIDPINDLWVTDEQTVIVNETPVNARVNSIGGDTLTSVNTSLTVIPFARENEVTVRGRFWFVPGDPATYSLRCSMSGIEIENFDAVISGDDYSFEWTFTIPANIPAGIIPVRVWTEPAHMEATTNYFAHGLNYRQEAEVTRRTVIPDPPLTVVIVESPMMDPMPPLLPPMPMPMPMLMPVVDEVRGRGDPIAQTFVMERDMFITSIGVFFRNKSAIAPVTCFIKETLNGYPTGSVIAHKTLSADEVLVSDDGSVETKFVFDDPVFIQGGIEYCFMLFSTDIVYTVYVAQQGKNDVITGELVVAQPYIGVFFMSSNNSAWTAMQDMDMKFRLYRADFVSDGMLTMQPQNINDSWLLVSAGIREPMNTKCQIQYKLGTAEWVNIIGGARNKIANTELVPQCTVRFLLQTQDSYVSPVLLKTVGTLYWHYKSKGYFYTYPIDVREGNEFDRVRIRFYAIPNDVPFIVSIACSKYVSLQEPDWKRYDSTGDRCVVKNPILVDGKIGLMEYDYTFDISDNFHSYDLARYLQIAIFMGNESYNGVDTVRISDLRAVMFEAV